MAYTKLLFFFTAADNMTYTCVCPLGYVGDNCDIRSTLPTTTQPPTSPPTTTPINYCVAGRCSNGGTCLSLANGFRCECLLGFSGVYCMNELEENTYVYHAQVSDSLHFFLILLKYWLEVMKIVRIWTKSTKSYNLYTGMYHYLYIHFFCIVHL